MITFIPVFIKILFILEKGHVYDDVYSSDQEMQRTTPHCLHSNSLYLFLLLHTQTTNVHLRRMSAVFWSRCGLFCSIGDTSQCHLQSGSMFHRTLLVVLPFLSPSSLYSLRSCRSCKSCCDQTLVTFCRFNNQEVILVLLQALEKGKVDHVSYGQLLGRSSKLCCLYGYDVIDDVTSSSTAGPLQPTCKISCILSLSLSVYAEAWKCYAAFQILIIYY